MRTASESELHRKPLAAPSTEATLAAALLGDIVLPKLLLPRHPADKLLTVQCLVGSYARLF